jgi:isopentenyl-diphosphate delta-isomerase
MRKEEIWPVDPATRERDRAPPKEDSLILVDGRDRPLGPMGKREVHERGLRHRAFSIFLVDAGGRTLLQRRHPSKYHSGGLWANSCCGHPRWGEGTNAAARRRLHEELGIDTPLRPVFRTRYDIRFDNGLSENEAVTVLFGPWRGEVRPDPEEVAGIRWLGLHDLRREIAAEPQTFAYWLRHYVAAHGCDLDTGIAEAAALAYVPTAD